MNILQTPSLTTLCTLTFCFTVLAQVSVDSLIKLLTQNMPSPTGQKMEEKLFSIGKLTDR